MPKKSEWLISAIKKAEIFCARNRDEFPEIWYKTELTSKEKKLLVYTKSFSTLPRWYIGEDLIIKEADH